MSEKHEEMRIRRSAKRLGWRVLKSRVRVLHANNKGAYQLVDDRNVVILGADYDASPADIADHIAEAGRMHPGLRLAVKLIKLSRGISTGTAQVLEILEPGVIAVRMMSGHLVEHTFVRIMRHGLLTRHMLIGEIRRFKEPVMFIGPNLECALIFEDTAFEFRVGDLLEGVGMEEIEEEDETDQLAA